MERIVGSIVEHGVASVRSYGLTWNEIVVIIISTLALIYVSFEVIMGQFRAALTRDLAFSRASSQA